MRLSAGQNAFVLRCACGPSNQVFSGKAVEIRGKVTCRVCGRQKSWQDLRSDCGQAGAGAEIHLLHQTS